MSPAQQYGRVAVGIGREGWGFIEPDAGGGQVLVRSSSVAGGGRLRPGDVVRYTLEAGAFAMEAAAVTRVPTPRF